MQIIPLRPVLPTYSKEDRSIAGWNVEDMDKVQLKFDQTVKINEDKGIEVYVFLMIRNLLILVMIINVLLLVNLFYIVYSTFMKLWES
ncbi:unnamed protein product [Rhizophagus irregularis]|nr:unnamed protein product [Rhizophagus irregularis]